MINIKNIIKVLLVAMFICICSLSVTDAKAQLKLKEQEVGSAKIDWSKYSSSEASKNNCPSGTLWNAITGKCISLTKESCPEGQYRSSPDNKCRKSSTPKVTSTSNTQQDASFCGADTGVFSELIRTGQEIFNRLRDLIYVVAGFGIIAVAVGGFFGNLNWKWLGAIVISLVVIATAGELIVLLTGCSEYGTSLITNTLQNPTEQVKAVE